MASLLTNSINRETPHCAKYFKETDTINAAHLGLIVDKVALGQVILRALRFSLVDIIPSMLHTHASSAVVATQSH
jgi:hypothetical protein